MYGKKIHLKRLRLAANVLVAAGLPFEEEFTFFLPGKLAPVKVTGKRIINHYRRMKRLMKNQHLNPEQAIAIYKSSVK